MWLILKVFIEFVTILLFLFMFWFFGIQAHGLLAPWLGMESAPPVLEGKVLTIRPARGVPRHYYLTPCYSQCYHTVQFYTDIS